MKRIALILILILVGSLSYAQKDNQNKNQQASGNSQSSQKSNDQETRFNENSSGVKRSIAYRFRNTGNVPSDGIFMLNSGTVSGVTSIIVNDKDIKGEDQSQWYSTWARTTGATARGQITLVDSEYRNVAKFDVTGVFVDMSGYWRIPVRYVSGGMPSDGQLYYYIFERIDNKKDNSNKQPDPPVTAQVNPPAQPNIEQPSPTEQPKAEEPKPVEQPKAEEPKPVEQPKAEEPQPVEQPKAEEPQPVEQPKAVEPKPVEQPKAVDPKPVEQPKAEEPKPVEQPKTKEPVPAEQPKTEKPKPVEPKTSEPGPVEPVKTEVPKPADKPQAEIPKHPEPAGAGESKPQPARQTTRTVDPVSRRQAATEPRTTQTPPVDRQPSEPEPAQRTQPAPQPATQPVTQPTQPGNQTTVQVPQQPAQKSGTTWTSQVTQGAAPSQNYYAPPSYQSNLPTYQYRYSTGRASAGKWYAGIIEAGYGLGVSEYGINNFRLNFINGFHIGQTFSIGLGIGVRRYFFTNEDFSLFRPVSGATRLPVFLDLRKTFSTRKVTPYLALGLGGSARLDADTTESQNEGFLFNPSGGIWFNISSRFAVFCGVAYEMQNMEFYFLADDKRFRENSNSVSLNIGIAF